MKPFRRRRRGRVTATFDQDEAHLVANLCAQVVELLRDRNAESQSSPDPLAQLVGMDGPVLPPEDPVLARLLPDAYRDDADDAAEFRRYTERSLTNAKVENAQQVISSLAGGGMAADSSADVEVELDAGSVLAWLRALTDVRLALAVRLGIETDDDVERLSVTDDEAEQSLNGVYEWLGFVQESLVHAAG